MRVVAITAHTQDTPLPSELTARADILRVGPAPQGTRHVDHVLSIRQPSTLARRIEGFAWRSPLGRNLIRVTPLDRSRRLWRAARSDHRLRAILSTADIVVALDRDAILTVWKLARMRDADARWDAVYGGPAALFALKNRI